MWYKFYDFSLSKAEAQAHCQAEGANLPIILNAENDAAVGAIILSGAFIDAVWAQTRFGLAWTTESGFILDYLPWGRDEPQGDDCVQRRPTDGLWNDFPCDMMGAMPFGCQWGLKGKLT